MNQFDYSLPTQRIIFGAGSIKQLDTLLDPHGRQRFLLCTSSSQRRAGVVAAIQDALGDAPGWDL